MAVQEHVDAEQDDHRQQQFSGSFDDFTGGFVHTRGFLDNRIMGLGTYGHLFSAGAIPLIYVFVGIKVGFELSAVLDRFRKEDTGPL